MMSRTPDDAFSAVVFTDAFYLSVPERHVGTQTADVGLTGIVQLRFQPNVLRLRGMEEEEVEVREKNL